MGTKRKRENLVGKPRSKRQKKDSLLLKVDNASFLENKFETLQNHLDEESDSELIYDYDRKKSEELTDDLVLIDSEENPMTRVMVLTILIWNQRRSKY